MDNYFSSIRRLRLKPCLSMGFHTVTRETPSIGAAPDGLPPGSSRLGAPKLGAELA
ncbi:MAG: hypothetical protein JEZ12_26825 [Desulfobacterium sp.]|nr:hypothetical protein [Desulfobacterium sp.]